MEYIAPYGNDIPEITPTALEALRSTELTTTKRSGVDRERDELKKCLDYVREGDTLRVTKFDRLAIASDIQARRSAGESFRSIAKSVGFSVATVQNVLKSAASVVDNAG
ncbi:helix-turn-helix domain-containing protein [Phyllobacterium chamaecytisi]|uniref:helix-turn-helix domain-containing protein n=1 Tax=Phyllobacterium chamaecytisi TaxID=2876082 RepID=UPI001CCA85E4|nr:recombinase family protein [Phyllobacterium sp. KW56]MBZ9602894.1 recombinase family protein [Phyllobacterium sp. KW56]